MKIFIDTSSLREIGNNFNRPEYLKLEKLCTEYDFSIVLHEISKLEFETQLTHPLQEEISKIKTSLSRITNKVNESALENELLLVMEKLDINTSKIEQDIINPFQAWLSRCKCEIVTIEETNSSAVFTDYFSGDGMFSKKKSRDDIPDSFILEGVTRKIDDNSEVVVICSDKRLAEQIKEKIECELFFKIGEFLESDIVNELTFEFSLGKMENKFGHPFLEKTVAREEIKSLIISTIENYDWSCFYLDENSEENPSIVGHYDVIDIKYTLSSWHDNVIVVSCNYEANVDIEYFKFKSDYFAMADEELSKASVEDWNKHYFLISTSKTLSFEVECEIFFEDGQTFSVGEDEEEIIEQIVYETTCEINNISVLSSMIEEF